MQEEGSVTLDTESMKALSSEARGRILKALDEKRMTLSDLSRELNLSKPTLKEHLAKLESTQLVSKADEGRKWKYYSLSRKGRQILHPGLTRFKILFSFSLSMIVLSVVMMLYVWIIRTGTFVHFASECYSCGNPLYDTFIPMFATLLAIFGLIVMIYAYRELKMPEGHKVLSPPE
ncbi:MAG: winged helix-turn-helix transcriptional regulator [Thermoplasmata archaeon]|nr:winged helix-turn-helix transcriptional regulator [Thermoplasmata archaeon]